MKHIISLTILSVLGFIAVANAGDASWGSQKPYERLLHREIVTEKKKFMRVVTKDLEFPKPGMNNGIISRIVVTDQKEHSKQGHASLIAGGPGSPNVKIHLKSSRNHGLSFIVEIFGN